MRSMFGRVMVSLLLMQFLYVSSASAQTESQKIEQAAIVLALKSIEAARADGDLAKADDMLTRTLVKVRQEQHLTEVFLIPLLVIVADLKMKTELWDEASAALDEVVEQKELLPKSAIPIDLLQVDVMRVSVAHLKGDHERAVDLGKRALLGYSGEEQFQKTELLKQLVLTSGYQSNRHEDVISIGLPILENAKTKGAASESAVIASVIVPVSLIEVGRLEEARDHVKFTLDTPWFLNALNEQQKSTVQTVLLSLSRISD